MRRAVFWFRAIKPAKGKKKATKVLTLLSLRVTIRV